MLDLLLPYLQQFRCNAAARRRLTPSLRTRRTYIGPIIRTHSRPSRSSSSNWCRRSSKGAKTVFFTLTRRVTVLPLAVRTRTFLVTLTTFGTWIVSGPGSVAFARVVTVTPDGGVARPVTAPMGMPTATASNAMITMRRPLASAYIANNGTSNSGGELLRLVG